MTMTNEAAPGGSEQASIDVAVHQAAGEGPLSTRAAALAVTDWRRKRHAKRSSQQRAPQASAEPALAPADGAAPADSPDASARTDISTDAAAAGLRAAADRSAQVDEITDAVEEADVSAEAAATADAGEPDAPPGETERTDPAEPPPIEPPRSWTKEDKALFRSLPRETQERIAERERSRDSDFSRRQQEATERAKALAAQHSKVEQARQFYENALPAVLQSLQGQISNEFADIRTAADVEKMAKDDLPRYVRWDLQQKQAATLQQALGVSLVRQAQEREQAITRSREREIALLMEKAPEYADDAQRERMQSAAVAVLNDLGYDDTELGQLWRGERDLSFHDHRLHLLVRDAARWREAQDKAKAAQSRPVPPVQRPGVAQPKGAAREAALQNLSRQLDSAKGMNALRAAAKLVAERRKANG